MHLGFFVCGSPDAVKQSGWGFMDKCHGRLMRTTALFTFRVVFALVPPVWGDPWA